ncbi:MAG: TIGR04283 family arsenosugar biosynthesis glycosyltransferase [Desulfuromonadaceae bacterium]|nr:TIGR04283 family arsenosugar biosynthesis glycosyltransferase [Desulfuromonadaceae bacterium]
MTTFDPPILLTVIIPTYNEEETLPVLLNDLRKQEHVSLETIIADGGSVDRTQAVAEAFGAIFIKTSRGRGSQMNAATERAQGSCLLFLHADTAITDPDLLSNALQAFAAEFHCNENVAGHFQLSFKRTTKQNNMAYRYAEEKTAFNRMNTTNGDQGLLLTTAFFKKIGGFDERLPFLEDQRIAEKIRCQGMLMTLPGTITTSARRFEKEGFHRRYILMSMIMGLHSIGVETFFTRAPGLYQVQQETARLLLSPFFGLIWKIMAEEWGVCKTISTFYKLGRYIRQNSWQMFYFLDVWIRPLLGRGRYPFLNFHDRIFAPCTTFPVFNAITGILCFIWFMGILSPFFWVTDNVGKKMRT